MQSYEGLLLYFGLHYDLSKGIDGLLILYLEYCRSVFISMLMYLQSLSPALLLSEYSYSFVLFMEHIQTVFFSQLINLFFAQNQSLSTNNTSHHPNIILPYSEQATRIHKRNPNNVPVKQTRPIQIIHRHHHQQQQQTPLPSMKKHPRPFPKLPKPKHNMKNSNIPLWENTNHFHVPWMDSHKSHTNKMLPLPLLQLLRQHNPIIINDNLNTIPIHTPIPSTP